MRVFALIMSGFVIWALAFLTVYSLHATGCSLSWSRLRAVLVGATVVFLALGVQPILWSVRESDPFVRRIASLTNISAWAATALTLVGVLWLATCATLVAP